MGAAGDRVSLFVFSAAERTSEAADGSGYGSALRQLRGRAPGGPGHRRDHWRDRPDRCGSRRARGQCPGLCPWLDRIDHDDRV
ncbi:conserved hypothetical protein [uncultured Defluviicoccus sp.]|uniref:Uncharacterized protein n=1 Tax=metagenome TaxID=256318 RepID=A0A380TK77_9ZZZZ|nr:conserved hypothetical protein [uncultured Defluviicoccus sp.]